MQNKRSADDAGSSAACASGDAAHPCRAGPAGVGDPMGGGEHRSACHTTAASQSQHTTELRANVANNRDSLIVDHNHTDMTVYWRPPSNSAFMTFVFLCTYLSRTQLFMHGSRAPCLQTLVQSFPRLYVGLTYMCIRCLLCEDAISYSLGSECVRVSDVI